MCQHINWHLVTLPVGVGGLACFCPMRLLGGVFPLGPLRPGATELNSHGDASLGLPIESGDAMLILPIPGGDAILGPHIPDGDTMLVLPIPGGDATLILPIPGGGPTITLKKNSWIWSYGMQIG